MGSKNNSPVKREIKMYWWRGNAGRLVNVGDEVNGRIVEYASGRGVTRTYLSEAELLAIGSVVHFPQREGVLQSREAPYLVWGSGSLNASPIINQEKFCLSSLRGPLTNSLFGNRSSMTFGDPGLLASRVWEEYSGKVYKWGIIPHHSQRTRPWVRKLVDSSHKAIVIDVTNPDIDATISLIKSCEQIASTSLHGLIFADSFKIPSIWLWDGALHSGGAWKFFDYFSGIERNLSDSVSPNKVNNLEDVDVSLMSFGHFSKIDLICNRIEQSIPI